MTFITNHRSDEARQIATDLIREASMLKTDVTSLEILLCNLTSVPPGEQLQITFNNTLLSRNHLPPASKMLSAVELLVASNVVTWTQGQKGKRKMNQLTPTALMRRIDPASIYTVIPDQIIVKGKPNKKGERKVLKVPYNRESRQVEKDLNLINSVLRKAKIRSALAVPDPNLDLTLKQLYRVFHLDLKNHGRFYGGWWERAHAEDRSFITIDGDFTTELDFSSMHPTILYRLADAREPQGLYRIKGYDRCLVKVLFLIMLNTRDENHACRALRRNHKEHCRLTNAFIKPLIKKIQQKHRAIARHFFTNPNGMLTRIDSTIANRVLVHFARKGITVLPVHDSFIISNIHKKELQQVMQESFDAVLFDEIGKARPRNPEGLADSGPNDTATPSNRLISSALPSNTDLPEPRGFPSTFPLALARASPSFVRSETKSRSSPANS